MQKIVVVTKFLTKQHKPAQITIEDISVVYTDPWSSKRNDLQMA